VYPQAPYAQSFQQCRIYSSPAPRLAPLPIIFPTSESHTHAVYAVQDIGSSPTVLCEGKRRGQRRLSSNTYRSEQACAFRSSPTNPCSEGLTSFYFWSQPLWGAHIIHTLCMWDAEKLARTHVTPALAFGSNTSRLSPSRNRGLRSFSFPSLPPLLSPRSFPSYIFLGATLRNPLRMSPHTPDLSLGTASTLPCDKLDTKVTFIIYSMYIALMVSSSN